LERTGGNPFFVTEVVAAGDAGIPETVRDAVLARVARLSMPARGLLDAIAIVPRPVELWLLESLVQGPPGALDECLGAGILSAAGDSVAFRHELARLAMEESLAPDRRVALHRLALAALGDPPTGARDLARLAHHAEAAGDGRAVLRHAPAAAEHASRVGAHREAQAQYERALRFAAGLAPEARADLLMRFAEEGFLTDMRDAAVDALGEAIAIHRQTGGAEALSEALRLRSRILGCGGDPDQSRADASEAVTVLDGLPPGPQHARAFALMSGMAMAADDPATAVEWGDRAIEVGERVGDIESLVRALIYVGTVQLAHGAEAGRTKLERGLALAREHHRLTDVGLGYINLCGALGRRRRWYEADPHLAAGIRFCTEHGLEAWASCLIGQQAESHLAQGRWTAAADTATALLDRTPDKPHEDRLSALLALAGVRARRGDPEVWPLLDGARSIAESFATLQFLGPVAAARAEAAWLEGRSAAVAGEAGAALVLAETLDDRWRAAELACWQLRAGLGAASPIAEGPYALELAGRHRAAAEQWQALNCPYEAALALASSPEERDLREALERLQALGARPAAGIVARRLRERGARNVPKGPRARTQANPAGLTARELEVLALLADGLRDAEIADRLVLSKKTVGHHVSAVLRKLGVASRGQAAAAAVRDGLLEAPAR
jgi:DNA-binding CsgD family transcriptional regulator